MFNETIGKYFGTQVKQYSQGRKGYPEEVLELLRTKLSPDEPILDIGCGTGISTRGLWDHGFHNLVAADVDAYMIEEARRFSRHTEIQYHTADSTHLPFRQGTFSAITAFACYHWFFSERNTYEISRVLRPSGLFFIVNKDDLSFFRERYNQWINEISGQNIPHVKSNYFPLTMLSKCGFSFAETYRFRCNEIYTLEEAINYCQSISIWNILSEEQKKLTVPKIKEFLKNHLENEKLIREIEITCILSRSIS